MSTQQGFGLVLNEIARGDSELASRIVTASPDVTVSTNLGAWVNRRGLFAKAENHDLFRQEKIPSTFNWDYSPKGQHLELGIAEMNLFIMLSALGLSHAINGERLLPVGTLYDPFIERGLDALNYACYQDARFMVVATPSGITLAPEGGAHQSIATPLIGMAQDGLASFEPAFVDELAVIMGWGFRHMQREAGEGGSVYLRLSTRTLDQPQRIMAPELQSDITEGAYWLREPGPNCDIVIAYTGAVAPEAIEAVGLIGESHRDVGLLAVTSADRLHAGWSAARNLRRERRGIQYLSHVEKLLAPLPRDCGIVTVIDGHPAALGWLGSVRGNRVEALGVEQFGQTGTIRRPLPPLRHRRQRHHRCGRKPDGGGAGAAPQDGGVRFLSSPGGGGSVRMKCEPRWGDSLSTSNSARVERLSPHPVSHSAALHVSRPAPSRGG